MSRSFRIFMIIYAAAMIVVTVGAYIQRQSGREYADLWFFLGCAAFSYTALALGYLMSRDRAIAPGTPWMALLFASVLSLPVSILFFESPISASDVRFTAFTSAGVLAYLALTALLLRDLRSGMRWHRARRVLTPAILIVSACLVFSSVFLKITDDGTGWSVLTRRANWITSGINAGTGIFGPTVRWLEPFYQPGGYVAYGLSLVAPLVILIGLVAARMSIDRLLDFSIAARSAVAIGLVSLWVMTDIFWGWHFDLSNTPWAAALATSLWLAGPVFGAVLLVPFLWKRDETWRLRAFLVFQIPIAGFNFALLQAYYGPENVIEIPGLAVLIIGLQLACWACVDIFAFRREKNPVIHQFPDKQGKIAA